MKHIAALITAGVLITAALVATAFAENDKSNNTEANPSEEIPVLIGESFVEYSGGEIADQGETRYTYDEQGRCVSITTGDSVTVIEYDKNTVTKTSDSTVSIYEYDENGNLLSSRIYVDGTLRSESLYTYDEEGRKLSYSYSMPSMVNIVTKQPETEESETTPAEQEPGKPTGGLALPQPVDMAAVTSGRTEYSYDAEGLLVREVTINGLNEITKITDYSYDADGVLLTATMTNENGSLICVYRYTYDGDGRLVRESEYDAEGTMTCGTEYDYTEEGRLTAKTVITAQGVIISREVHAYDEDGREIKTAVYSMDELCMECSYEYAKLSEINK